MLTSNIVFTSDGASLKSPEFDPPLLLLFLAHPCYFLPYHITMVSLTRSLKIVDLSVMEKLKANGSLAVLLGATK